MNPNPVIAVDPRDNVRKGREEGVPVVRRHRRWRTDAMGGTDDGEGDIFYLVLRESHGNLKAKSKTS